MLTSVKFSFMEEISKEKNLPNSSSKNSSTMYTFWEDNEAKT